MTGDESKDRVSSFPIIPEHLRPTVSASIEIVDIDSLEEALLGFLERDFMPYPLTSLNRFFGVKAKKLTGKSLKVNLERMTAAGRLAIRWNERQRRTYVYGPTAWSIVREKATTLNNKNMDGSKAYEDMEKG